MIQAALLARSTYLIYFFLIIVMKKGIRCIICPPNLKPWRMIVQALNHLVEIVH